MSTVKDILLQKGQQVWYVTPETTLRDALKLMAAKNIGAVIVLDGHDVVGIISERDYARKVITSESLSLDEPVRTVMTSSVYYVTPEHTVEECMNLMTTKHFRHLPVIVGQDVIGLVSIGDVSNKSYPKRTAR
jgi:CBS domain-containing protein